MQVNDNKDFQPLIVAFCCNWCSYAGADLAGNNRLNYPADVKIIRVPCSCRVNPMFILRAFQRGADGVISLIVTDNTINAVGSQGLVLSYTDSDGMTISCEYNLFGAHGKKNVEYTLKLEKTDSGYVIRGMYD